MLILGTLQRANAACATSGEVLQMKHGSLYPGKTANRAGARPVGWSGKDDGAHHAPGVRTANEIYTTAPA